MSRVLLIKPKFSILLCLFFSVLYIISFMICIIANMPFLLHFVLEVFIIVNFIYVLRRFVLYRHPLSIKRLWCENYGNWKIQCRDSHVRTAELKQSVIISHYLILLSFKVPGRFFQLALPLAHGSVSTEALRNLRYVLTSKPVAENVSLP